MADDELHMQDVSEEEVNAMEATTNAVKQQRKQHTSLQKRTPVKLEHRHRAQSIIQSKALDELETEVFETGLYENSDLSTGSSYGVMGAEILYSKGLPRETLLNRLIIGCMYAISFMNQPPFLGSLRT